MAWVLALAAGLSGSLVQAAVSRRLLESPCLSLKRWFPYRPASTPSLPEPHIPLTQSIHEDGGGVPSSSAAVQERRTHK